MPASCRSSWEQRRATSPSTRPSNGPGDQGHLPPHLPPTALLCICCCDTGFSSPCISLLGLDLARSCSLFATLIHLHPSSTSWPIDQEKSPIELGLITIGPQTRSHRGGWGLPACHSGSGLSSGWLCPHQDPVSWPAGTGSKASGGLQGEKYYFGGGQP